MKAALSVKKLGKKYGALTAVDSVSFDIKPGEVFGLLGPNGAGKTSIISCITTLEKPTSGSIEVFGVDVTTESLKAKSLIGVVHQEIITSGFFSVYEILQFMSGYYGIKKNDERILFLLKKLQLFEHKDKLVKQLSGGMKRRLMIAKALVHSPKLLLLDEPTAGVDIGLRESLWDFVRELQREGISILLTTHYLEEAENLCSRISIINRGNIECSGATSEVIDQYSKKEITLKLSHSIDIQSDYLASANGSEYVFRVPTKMALGQLLEQTKVNPAFILDLQVQNGSLEKAFVKVLDKGEVK